MPEMQAGWGALTQELVLELLEGSAYETVPASLLIVEL